MKKKIYIGLSLDIIHHGHINLINKAKKLGNVTVGLYTDKAVTSHKRIPLLDYDQRKVILQNIQGVNKIVSQNEWDYTKNILKYKPDIMVHGDDWKSDNVGKILRSNAIKALKKIGGRLIEIPHTKNISSGTLIDRIYSQGFPTIEKKNYLQRLIEAKDICRFIEAHSPLSAIISEKAEFISKSGQRTSFDGFWSSSLTDSTLKGKPDIEILDLNQRLTNINEIFDVTSKPLIMDIDTGGKKEHLDINIKNIERNGISAVIMEDKKGLKKNSLFGVEVKQEQENIKEFSKKISSAKKSTKNKLMIIARIESLILNKPISDALKRADHYLAAGADGIMIHSRKKSTKEIFGFSRKFRKKYPSVPLVAVPSSYNKVSEKQLIKEGFNIVIYANHMLRAAYPAMKKIALEILKNGRSFESDKTLLSIKEILDLIPGTK
ncbi:phosphoenolpyruvate mutase [Pelagibacterales bacterium SAG-MED39]|nr:phosphoenolpyruvate mutase [Pelagibacterales bacterium SAG-MED39]